MAYLTLPQVQDIVERKRRRDLGSLRNPMDILEGQYGLNDPSNPYLQGIDQAGLLNMTSAREVPAFSGTTQGRAEWGPGYRDISILPQVTDVLDPMRNPSKHLTPNQYEDVMTHEVGHLGEQAVGNYRNWGDDVEDRSHNMLYGRNVGGVFDPRDPYFGTPGVDPINQDYRRGILSDRLGGDQTLKHVADRHKWVPVDTMDAQERLADVNRQSKFE